MRSSYNHDQIVVLPNDLQLFAWSAPMRELAAKVGLSDVGLKKLLRSFGVVTPPQGYWNKLHAGRPLPKCPKAPPRAPGETGRVFLDMRFAKVLPPVAPLSSAGPFKSASVPEDLGELYAQELTAMGRAAVPKTMERSHPGLASILKQEQRRREKFGASAWSWDAPRFESALDKRRLRILNAIFMALSRRGHSSDAYERDGEIHATAIIGDTHVGLELDVAGKRPKGTAYGGVGPDLAAATPLSLSLKPRFDGTHQQSWQDDAAGKLETRIERFLPASSSLARRPSAAGCGKPKNAPSSTAAGKKSAVRKRSRDAMLSASSAFGQAASCYGRRKSCVP